MRQKGWPDMGATNVALAFHYWSILADRPFRVLLYMALVSMDTDCPPRYFGGYPAIARALGRDASDVFDRMSATVGEKRRRKADMEAVRVAVASLSAAGAVVCDVPEAPGRGPEFALVLDDRARVALATVQANPAQRSRRTLPTVQANPADLGGVGGVTFDEEEQRGTPGGTTSPKVSSSLAPVENSEIDYDAAAKILERLPDLGQGHLHRVASIEGLRNRVIAAAILASNEKTKPEETA